MAVGLREWNVLQHKPIEKLASNLWRVEGRMSDTNWRVMLLVRLADGRLVMHNAIALDEPSMREIDQWGEVAAILIPNRFHRQDAFIMQQRYTKARVYAPRGALQGASRATPCSGSYGDVPVDSSLVARELGGIGEREGVLIVRSEDGVSAVFCDTVLNLPKLGGPMGFILHPTGTLSVPRATRWLFAKDSNELRRDLEAIAETPNLTRVIPGHGPIVREQAAGQLLAAAKRL